MKTLPDRLLLSLSLRTSWDPAPAVRQGKLLHCVTQHVIVVPDIVSGKCLDPGVRGVSPGKSVWGEGGGNPSQALPVLTPQKSRSRDPAAMEETCAKSTPYSFKMWPIRVSGQQSEDIVLLHEQLTTMFDNIFTSVFMQYWHVRIIVVLYYFQENKS